MAAANQVNAVSAVIHNTFMSEGKPPTQLPDESQKEFLKRVFSARKYLEKAPLITKIFTEIAKM
jgi:hypothetical protein